MVRPVYALLLLSSGWLAAGVSLPGDAGGQAHACPTPAGLWQALETLLTPEDFRDKLPVTAQGTLRIDDLGDSFRISLLGKEREYRDEARDCARRARVGALFAALVIDPSMLVRPAPATGPLPPPSTEPLPAPKPSQPQAVSPTEPARSSPQPRETRLEAGAAMMGGLDGPAWAPAWGGGLKWGMGAGTIQPVLGLGAFWTADTELGGVHVRQWRMPLDLDLRATVRRWSIAWYAEVGLVTALLRERATELSRPRSGTAIELGGRLALGARFASDATVAPFVAVSLDVIPAPPSVVALPAGTAGATSSTWLTACLGLSWRAR